MVVISLTDKESAISLSVATVIPQRRYDSVGLNTLNLAATGNPDNRFDKNSIGLRRMYAAKSVMFTFLEGLARVRGAEELRPTTSTIPHDVTGGVTDALHPLVYPQPGTTPLGRLAEYRATSPGVVIHTRSMPSWLNRHCRAWRICVSRKACPATNVCSEMPKTSECASDNFSMVSK